ncbi:MAG: transposase, partial [Desulfobacterales bacterium]|nr:transposase [Desulfobacterales bacterium]
MILSQKSRDYFKSLQAKVSQAMTRYASRIPYFLDDDPVIKNYEIIRQVWFNDVGIKKVCQEHKISRSQYYEKENGFVKHGVLGLFPEIRTLTCSPYLERLILIVSNARPSLSQQAMLRVAEAVPLTREVADIECISQILASYGRSTSDQPSDRDFWDRIQRTLNQLSRLKERAIRGRNKKQRKKTFFHDQDLCHKRLELLRELFFDRSKRIKEICLQYGMAPTSYYRLVEDYRLFGPWAVIPANLPGKEAMSSETELTIVLEKLRHPYWSAQQIVKLLKLRCSRFAVNRVFSRWALTDKNRAPVALDQYCPSERTTEDKPFTAITSAYHLHSEQFLLESRRINRHFELICKKMRTHAYHLCDPGPLLLAPFVNDLGIVQAMESHGPLRLRGKELTNLALLNVFRILGGYRRINHLSNNRDRSVALASGLGIFGTRSRYYQDTVEFKFDQLHALRCDLVSRAKELEIIKGIKIAFDFHFKRFFGEHSKEKGLGKGPDKSGDLVPGFRPHVAWDLATNTILSMTYYHGGVRAPGIVEQYCEQHIFPLFDPRAIREIYMDSEYTKEGTLHYFKQVRCPNGDVYLCLKKNKQIKKLIAPALTTEEGWEKHDNEDEIKAIVVTLPKTQLPLKIVILRDLETRKNIRCFGSTNIRLSSEDLLKKYSYRWLVENGLKDLVYSYFVDEMYGSDPEKIEFEFYCVMVARLTYEYFLKELGGEHYRHKDGNKTTLNTMRNLLFEKRNFTLEQDSNGNFVLTLLDTNGNDLEQRIAAMLDERMTRGENKVLWWGNRGLILRFDEQYKPEKRSGEVARKVSGKQ